MGAAFFLTMTFRPVLGWVFWPHIASSARWRACLYSLASWASVWGLRVCRGAVSVDMLYSLPAFLRATPAGHPVSASLRSVGRADKRQIDEFTAEFREPWRGAPGL